MVIAHHLRRAGHARGAVRIDQRLRIDCEMRRWLGVNIGRRHGTRDAFWPAGARPLLAQQNPAGFVRVRVLRGGQQRGNHIA